MATEQLVTHDVDRLLAQWPGLFDALIAHVNEVKKYGTIKQAIADAERRRAAAEASANEFDAKMATRRDKLNADFETETQAVRDNLAAKENEIAQRMTAAQLDADKIVEASNRQRDRILSEANNAATAVGDRVLKAQAQAVELEKTVAERQKKMVSLDTAIAAKQAELDQIEAARAAIIAKISA